jgi:hypothetical protein
MTGVINALLFDELRQPPFGLRTRDLVDASDYHCASCSLDLARYINAVATDVLRALNVNGTTLSGSARH